jgi:hypothetical protein
VTTSSVQFGRPKKDIRGGNSVWFYYHSQRCTCRVSKPTIQECLDQIQSLSIETPSILKADSPSVLRLGFSSGYSARGWPRLLFARQRIQDFGTCQTLRSLMHLSSKEKGRNCYVDVFRVLGNIRNMVSFHSISS